MNRDVSVFLDGARLTAALLVVAGHTESSFAPGFVPFIKEGHLATLAVGVFFVLSGFVIGYTVDQKEPDALSYFISRAARVYSVALPALMLTLLLDASGRWLAPEAYGTTITLWSFCKEVAKALISLTFVNEAWQWHLSPGVNVPFWSLAYEVPYYIAFGLWYFGAASWRVAAVVLLCAAGPYIIVLFSLWLFGLGCYRLSKVVSLSRPQGRALLIFSVLTLCFAPYFAGFFSELSPFGGGIVGLTQFFLAGIPFAGCIIGFRFSDLSFGRWGGVVRWAAGATFTIYLVHAPLGTFLRAIIIPNEWPLALRWVGIFSTIILSCLVIAQFTERKKEWWRMAFLQLVPPAMLTRGKKH